MFWGLLALVGRKADALGRLLLTSALKVQGKSDFRRWHGQECLSADWDSRTRKLAAFIEPGMRVIEFGAGRRVLERILPVGCAYTPSDLVDRGPGTIVCDLNDSELRDFPHYDVAVFGGVLEYLHDVRRVVAHVGRRVERIVVSYAVAQGGLFRRFSRRASGWVNDFTSDELVRLFESEGFRCAQRETWQSQEIFCFVKDGHPRG